MKDRLVSYAALAGAMLLAGSSVVAGKLLIKSFPVFLSSGISLLIALIFLVPVCIFKYGFKFKLSLKTALPLCLQAFTGTFLFRTLLFFGIDKTSATTGGLITSSAPVMVALLALLFLKEKLRLNKVIGIALTVAGIVISNIMGSTQNGTDTILGNVLVLLAVLGEASFSVISKFSDNSLSPLQKTTVVSFFALLFFIPFSIYDLMHFDVMKANYEVWIYLVYYGLFVTVLAFILWFRGIANTPASTSAVFSGFMPISSIILSLTVLNEKVTIFHLISLLLIMLGLITTLKPSLFRCIFPTFSQDKPAPTNFD